MKKARRIRYVNRSRRRRRAKKNPSTLVWLGGGAVVAYLLYRKYGLPAFLQPKKAPAPLPAPKEDESGVKGSISISVGGILGSGGLGSLG